VPNSVDIFRELQEQDRYDWPQTFATFLVRLSTDEKRLSDLIKTGTAWKIKLFQFLSSAGINVSAESDGKSKTASRQGENQRILNLAMSVLATIDVREFRSARNLRSKSPGRHSTLQWEDRRQSRWFPGSVTKTNGGRLAVEKTMNLVKKSAPFLSDEDKHHFVSHLSTLICNQILEDCKGDKKEAQEDTVATERWGKILKLMALIRLHVFIDDKTKGFTLMIGEGRFEDEDLVSSVARVLDTKSVTSLLSSERFIEGLQDAKNQRTRTLLSKRREGFQLYRDLFTSLASVMRRASEGSLRPSPQMMRASSGNQGRRTSRSRSRKSSVSTRGGGRPSRDKDLIHFVEKLEAQAAMKEKLVTTLVFFGYGSSSQVRATIKILEAKVKTSKGKRPGLLSPGGPGRFRVPAGANNSMAVHMLPEKLQEDVNKQVAKLPRPSLLLATSNNHSYPITLMSVPVTAMELGVEKLQGSVKSLVLLHQQVTASAFIINLFGVSFVKSHGYIKVVETVPCTLAEIYEGSEDERSRGSDVSGRGYGGIRRREHLSERLQMRLAVGIASGLECLHAADSYHGFLTPKSIGIDSSFNAKLLDFKIHPELDVKSNDAAYVAPEFFTRRKLGSLPKAEGMRSADVYACGVVVAEVFSSERRRIRAWLPTDIVTAFRNLEASLNPSNPQPKATFEVSKVLEKRRPHLAGFLTHCLSITAEHRLDMKKVRVAFQNIQKEYEEGKISVPKDYIHYLDAAQTQSVDAQLIPKNRIKSIQGNYHVMLSGIPVNAKALGVRSMQGQILQKVREITRLSVSPSILEVFGCAWSQRFGWLLVTEHIPTTLEQMFSSPPPEYHQRLVMAMGLVEAVCSFHANNQICYLSPSSVSVTSDFKLKLSPFQGSGKDNKGKLLPPEFSETQSPNSDIASSADSRSTKDGTNVWTIKSDVYVLGGMLYDWLIEGGNGRLSPQQRLDRNRESFDAHSPIGQGRPSNTHLTTSSTELRNKARKNEAKSSSPPPGRFLLFKSEPFLNKNSGGFSTGNSNPDLPDVNQRISIDREEKEMLGTEKGGGMFTLSNKLLSVPGAGWGMEFQEILDLCQSSTPLKRPTADKVKQALAAEIAEMEPQPKEDYGSHRYDRSSRRPTSPGSRSRNAISRHSFNSAIQAPNSDRVLDRKKKKHITLRSKMGSSMSLLEMPVDERPPISRDGSGRQSEGIQNRRKNGFREGSDRIVLSEGPIPSFHSQPSLPHPSETVPNCDTPPVLKHMSSKPFNNTTPRLYLTPSSPPGMFRSNSEKQKNDARPFGDGSPSSLQDHRTSSRDRVSKSNMTSPNSTPIKSARAGKMWAEQGSFQHPMGPPPQPSNPSGRGCGKGSRRESRSTDESEFTSVLTWMYLLPMNNVVLELQKSGRISAPQTVDMGSARATSVTSVARPRGRSGDSGAARANAEPLGASHRSQC